VEEEVEIYERERERERQNVKSDEKDRYGL
jgi:hypothetical protein